MLPCRHDDVCGTCWSKMYAVRAEKQRKRSGKIQHLRKQAVVFACPIYITPVLSLESRSTPPPPTLQSDVVTRSTLVYRDALTTSMHMCSLAIDSSIYTTDAWLCDNAMSLVLHYLNREQGPNGPVLFVSSLLLHQRNDINPSTLIDGRQAQACTTLFKAVHFNAKNWICVIWSRHQPDAVFVLDSLAHEAHASTKRCRTAMYNDAIQHFVHICEQLNGSDRGSVSLQLVPAAQQNDGSSCGLFVIESACILASPLGRHQW